MKKVDFKKEMKPLYQPSAKSVVEVDVPGMNFLQIDGEGDPNTAREYKDAVEALFAVSYAIKFMIKKGASAIDYGVMPLEGLWWADDMAAFATGNKSGWKWTMMIMQPSCVTREIVAEAKAQVTAKKKLTAVPQLKLKAFKEGKCAQTMHVGPFSAEGPTIQRVHEFIAARGKLSGKHHEIYLSDVRKADPAKWRTIIRQPMR